MATDFKSLFIPVGWIFVDQNDDTWRVDLQRSGTRKEPTVYMVNHLEPGTVFSVEAESPEDAITLALLRNRISR